MIRSAVIFTAITFAFPASARDPIFNIPLDCTLGDDCYIQKYVDHDPSPKVQDYQCGTLANDGHKGTDFALFDLRAMAKGVNVLAAAPGRVRAVRDSMPDISVRDPNAPDITGKECGNGIVVDHGGGWETQYCHLKRDSIIVQRGQKVSKGMAMGLVGLSGETEYPHVHLSVRYKGKVVDPFSSAEAFMCADPNQNSLWQDDFLYLGGGILNVGISAEMPKFQALKNGLTAPNTHTSNAAALILWAYAYGAEQGDLIQFNLIGPKGNLVTKKIEIDKTIALFFRATGRKRPAGNWPQGIYSGDVTMIRDGELLARRSIEVTVN